MGSAFDTNGDGTITRAEIGEVMKKLGGTVTEDEITALLEGMDIDGDGKVTQADFEIILKKALAAMEEELMNYFKEFDKDGSGSITAEELKQAVASMGEKISDKEAEEMIKEADADNDGKINFSEFCKKMMGKMGAA